MNLHKEHHEGTTDMNVSMINGMSLPSQVEGKANFIDAGIDNVNFAPLLAAMQVQDETPVLAPVITEPTDQKAATDEGDGQLETVLANLPVVDNVKDEPFLQKDEPSMQEDGSQIVSVVAVATPPIESYDVDTTPDSLSIVAPQKGLTTEGARSSVEYSGAVRDAATIANQQTDSRFMHPVNNNKQSHNGAVTEVSPSITESKPEIKLVAGESQANSTAAGSIPSTPDFSPARPLEVIHTNYQVDSGKNNIQMPPVVSLPEKTGTPEWDRSLGQQLACFTRDGIHHAELRLHPDELGAIQISMRMSGERMQMHFVADNPLAREALEHAMPHLRQSLADAGVNLGQSSVGSENESSHMQQGDKSSHSSEAQITSAGDDALLETIEAQETQPTIANYRSGINTFV
jgi:flagellar hook-length control protein FliK